MFNPIEKLIQIGSEATTWVDGSLRSLKEDSPFLDVQWFFYKTLANGGIVFFTTMLWLTKMYIVITCRLRAKSK